MIYIKIAGAVLVLAAGFLAGRVATGAWRRRAEQLGQLSWAMGALATEMNCLLSPLPQLLGKLAAKLPAPAGELFQETAAGLEAGTGITAQMAWEEALEKVGPRLCLLAEDLALLNSLGAYLGASELADQLKRLEGVGLQLEEQRQKAGEAAVREGKLIGFAWPAVALAVVILFW
jgi:stage III sporulation protein AB